MATDYQALYEAKCDELATLSVEIETAKLLLHKISIDFAERGYNVAAWPRNEIISFLDGCRK